jgi:polysaccharide export outer membrane protein
MKHPVVRAVQAISLSLVLAGCGSSAQLAPPPETNPRYLIAPDDILNVVFWREDQMSGEVVVRPDGKISVPLLNDVQAAGLTPEQLRDSLVTAAAKFMDDPNATVVVKQINSRKVFITGNVMQPGVHPLTSQMTVLQLLALAGGLQEYAAADDIVIVRLEDGNTQHYRFNYGDVISQKHAEQNIALRPGDTVVVP